MRQRVLGSKHPDTLRGINDLVDAYLIQGRYDQALPLCEQALVDLERVLGPDHPETQRARRNLQTLRAGRTP